MSLNMLVELLTLALALGGLLLQTRRDPATPPSWNNLSNGGRLILALLIAVASIKIVKGHLDTTAQREASNSLKTTNTQLLSTNSELLSTNQHLIKVMSVSSGYSAVLSGVALFDKVPNTNQVETALRNLFLKYAEVDIEASNRLGKYKGRVDYGAHPEVRRYLNFQRIHEDPTLLYLQSRVPEHQWARAFFFEIRCANLKILNQDKIQYARFDPSEQIQVSVRVFQWWHDFNSLYGVSKLYIDKLTIEELGESTIAKEF